MSEKKKKEFLACMNKIANKDLITIAREATDKLIEQPDSWVIAITMLTLCERLEALSE